MRIVSWNCCGSFRTKMHHIEKLNADVYIIQECEDPASGSSDEFAQLQSWAESYAWIGNKPSYKGLGIFATNTTLRVLDWPGNALRCFLPVEIGGQIILGVWACKPYIKEFFQYQELNRTRFDSRMIVMGDFNSNAIWDAQNGLRNHTAVVEDLQSVGLESAYHLKTGCKQGKEEVPTFHLQKNESKPFHIDYCFAAPEHVRGFSIEPFEKWRDDSDHVPLILEYSQIWARLETVLSCPLPSA